MKVHSWTRVTWHLVFKISRGWIITSLVCSLHMLFYLVLFAQHFFSIFEDCYNLVGDPDKDVLLLCLKYMDKLGWLSFWRGVVFLSWAISCIFAHIYFYIINIADPTIWDWGLLLLLFEYSTDPCPLSVDFIDSWNLQFWLFSLVGVSPTAYPVLGLCSFASVMNFLYQRKTKLKRK